MVVAFNKTLPLYSPTTKTYRHEKNKPAACRRCLRSAFIRGANTFHYHKTSLLNRGCRERDLFGSHLDKNFKEGTLRHA